MITSKWCVNCGKDSVRCKCKKPVINSEEAQVDRPIEAYEVKVSDGVDRRRRMR